MGRRGVCLHSHRRFFVRRRRGRRTEGAGKSSARNEKGGTEEARVTEEFRNDRWPVASLTDDALPRSRLQAQKDGTAVMDSKWLEIVGRCHRATPFSTSHSLSFSSYLYLFRLSVSSFIPRSKFTARDVLLQEQIGVRGTSQDSRLFFCASELSLARARLRYIFKKRIARHTEYFTEYVHRTVYEFIRGVQSN